MQPDYLPLIVAIVIPILGGAVTWGMLTGRVAALSQRVARCEGQIDELHRDARDTATKADLAALEARILAALDREITRD